MTFSFHHEAEIELTEAVDYYENYETGLGYDFSIEVFTSIQNIINYPTAWPIIEEDIRRCLVNRFPYGIIYGNNGDAHYFLKEGTGERTYSVAHVHPFFAPWHVLQDINLVSLQGSKVGRDNQSKIFNETWKIQGFPVSG